MRVIVLGCGGSSGVPMIGGDGSGDWGSCNPCEPRNTRTRSSIVIDGGGGRILVDTGPDLRQQLLSCRIPSVQTIVMTHAHADHVAGIDEVRGLNRAIGRPLAMLAFEETLSEIRERFAFAFLPWSPPGFYRPVLEPRIVAANTKVEVCGLTLDIFEQRHGRIRTLGLRAGPFAYSTDVVELGADALKTLKGVDTWLVDAFQREPHESHAHVERVIEWARDLGIRRTILTHMGPDLDWEWLIKHLPPGCEPGFDGLELSFDQSRRC